MKEKTLIADQIKKLIPSGTVIPKPSAKADFVVKGWGKRRGEAALIYFIPNHSDPDKPYEKGVTESEFQRAFQQLSTSGEFTRSWFNEHLSECAKEGGCNFTTIGGIFEMLGEAIYSEIGLYKQNRQV